jgi:hypothetical protein
MVGECTLQVYLKSANHTEFSMQAHRCIATCECMHVLCMQLHSFLCASHACEPANTRSACICVCIAARMSAFVRNTAHMHIRPCIRMHKKPCIHMHMKA